MKFERFTINCVKEIISTKLVSLNDRGKKWKFSYIVQVPRFVIGDKRKIVLIENKWYSNYRKKMVFGYIGGGVKSDQLQKKFCHNTSANFQKDDGDLRFLIDSGQSAEQVSYSIYGLLHTSVTEGITRKSIFRELYEELVEENEVLDKQDLQYLKIEDLHYVSLNRSYSKKSDHPKLLLASFIPISIAKKNNSVFKKLCKHHKIRCLNQSIQQIYDERNHTSTLYSGIGDYHLIAHFPVDLTESFVD